MKALSNNFLYKINPNNNNNRVKFCKIFPDECKTLFEKIS